MLRPPAPVVAVALVLVLAALVAVTSRETPLLAPLREGTVDRLEILLNVALLGAMGIALATTVAVVVHRGLIARRGGPPPLRATLLRAAPWTVVALVFVNLLAIARTDLGRVPEAGDPTHAMKEDSDRRARALNIVGWWGSSVRAGEGAPDQEAGPAQDPAPTIPPFVIVLAAVAMVVAGVVVWRWYGATRAPPDADPGDDVILDDPDEQAVHGLVVGSIDAMLADPDPNTAITGAYARLLEGLEACGSGRRAHEGPMEHIRRVLTRHEVDPAPLRQLTGLFELARFSTRPLTSEHREQALAALRELAGAIGGARPVQGVS